MAFVVILLLSIDLMGSTPVYKSSLHEDRLLKVVLDGEKCKGAGFCEQVCPRNCFQVDRKRRKATMPRADRCVQCGACIVQCLFDALYFKSLEDKIIPPQIIRKFKLNFMGKRLVKVEGRSIICQKSHLTACRARFARSNFGYAKTSICWNRWAVLF